MAPLYLRLLGIGLVGVSTLAASAVARAQGAKPAFLPAESPEKRDEGVPLDPILAAKLEANHAALANAHSPEEIVRCSMQQVEVLSQVGANLSLKERAPVIREIADCLCSASVYEPKARARLLALEQEVVQSMPGSDLAAYVTYREIEAGENGPFPAGRLHERLTAFIAAYPRSSETPTVLLQLGTSCEMTGKSEEAKGWYTQVVHRFPDTAVAAKAEGAVRRLNLEGKVFHLALPTLITENERKDTVFDVDELRGKIVIVYFWAAWQERCRADLEVLKSVLDEHRAQGVELLCVNLDKNPQAARDMLKCARVPGVHVFQRDGLDGLVAERFGLLTLPHLMLVGRDGTVIRQNAELTGMGDLLQKKPEPRSTVAGERHPE